MVRAQVAHGRNSRIGLVDFGVTVPTSTSKQLGEASLPLGLVDDLEAHGLAAHCRDELGPVALCRVRGADVEHRALVLGVSGLFKVEALGLDHEHLMERVVSARIVRFQREDEVGVDPASLPALDVVVLARTVAVPKEQGEGLKLTIQAA